VVQGDVTLRTTTERRLKMALAVRVKKGDRLIEKLPFRDEGRRTFIVSRVRTTKAGKRIVAWTLSGCGCVEIEFTGGEVRRIFDLVPREEG
jgi:hypothetical protein